MGSTNPIIACLEIILEDKGIYWYKIKEKRTIEKGIIKENHLILEIPKLYYLFKINKIKTIIKNEVLPAGIPLVIKRIK